MYGAAEIEIVDCRIPEIRLIIMAQTRLNPIVQSGGNAHDGFTEMLAHRMFNPSWHTTLVPVLLQGPCISMALSFASNRRVFASHQTSQMNWKMQEDHFASYL